MRFVFDKKFKFSAFPLISNCHNKYCLLLEKSYETEAKYESGESSNDDWIKAIDACDDFYIGEYAHTVFLEFFGHDLCIQDWKSKKIIKFDEFFKPPFEDISAQNKKLLVSIVEIKYALKLSEEFYEG